MNQPTCVVALLVFVVAFSGCTNAAVAPVTKGYTCPVFEEKCDTKPAGCDPAKRCPTLGQVCCQVSCDRRVCMKPVCPPITIGECFARGPVECTSDSQCTCTGSHCCPFGRCNGTKCTGGTQKPQCPEPGDFGPCYIDENCAEGKPCADPSQICCPAACGGEQCKTPV